MIASLNVRIKELQQ
jgi:hypothetical protein